MRSKERVISRRPVAPRRRPTSEQKFTAESLAASGRRKTLDSVADVSIMAYRLPLPGSSSGSLREGGGSSVALNGGTPIRPLAARSCKQYGDEAVAGPAEGGEPGWRRARRQGIGAGGEVEYYIVVRCR
jgi:hypothetical protein